MQETGLAILSCTTHRADVFCGVHAQQLNIACLQFQGRAERASSLAQSRPACKDKRLIAWSCPCSPEKPSTVCQPITAMHRATKYTYQGYDHLPDL